MPSAISPPAKPDADGPRRVPLPSDDRANGSYSVPQLQLALEGLHQDGMVVLQNVVSEGHCDKLHDHMSGDRDRILRERHAGAKVYNQGVKCMRSRPWLARVLMLVTANILQAPPFTQPELLFDDLHFNPYVIQVMNA